MQIFILDNRTYPDRRGVQAQNFWKDDFEPCVGGCGQDMYQQLEGGP